MGARNVIRPDQPENSKARWACFLEALEVCFKPAAPQKYSSLDNELAPPVRIKPPLLSLAPKACCSRGFSLHPVSSTTSLYKPSIPFTRTRCHLLPFLWHSPVPPMRGPGMASNKCLLKEWDVHAPAPRSWLKSPAYKSFPGSMTPAAQNSTLPYQWSIRHYVIEF